MGGGDRWCWQRPLGVEIPGMGICEICGRDVFIYVASYADLLLIHARILFSLPPDTLMFDVWGAILKYYLYLGYLDLAVWCCNISISFRWYGSENCCKVACIHTHLCMYLISSPVAYAARSCPDVLEVVRMADGSTCEWPLGPTVLF